MKTTIEMAREAWAEAGEGWVADAWFDDRAKAFEAFAAMVREEALAQPEQEQEPEWYHFVRYSEDCFVPYRGQAPKKATPLYTSLPPQRKSLTDDELSDIWFKQSTDWMEFARAIEAAHGIGHKT